MWQGKMRIWPSQKHRNQTLLLRKMCNTLSFVLFFIFLVEIFDFFSLLVLGMASSVSGKLSRLAVLQEGPKCRTGVKF